MKRKIIQDFANTVCQNYIDLNGGHDAAAFACYGSGTAVMDFLSGNCIFDSKEIPTLKSCTILKNWLHERFVAHNIVVSEIASAQMTITVAVSNLKLIKSYGHAVYSGCFDFDCHCEIRTDEKSYFGQMRDEKRWGFEEEYDALYGKPDVE